TSDHPIIPLIEGEGTRTDIWTAAKKILEAAVEKAYNGAKTIEWKEEYTGKKAYDKTGEWLPDETLQTIDEYKIAIKGPLTTPVGGGSRTVHVARRHELDLFTCLPPVREFSVDAFPVD